MNLGKHLSLNIFFYFFMKDVINGLMNLVLLPSLFTFNSSWCRVVVKFLVRGTLQLIVWNPRCSCSTEAKEETLVVLDEAETVDFGIAIGIIYKDFSTAHSFATCCVTSSLFHIFLIGNKLFLSCKVIDFVLGFKRTCYDIF